MTVFLGNLFPLYVHISNIVYPLLNGLWIGATLSFSFLAAIFNIIQCELPNDLFTLPSLENVISKMVSFSPGTFCVDKTYIID